MKIAVHAPFGTLSEETGVIHLLAKYLRGTFEQMVQVRCNGIFSLCDRDGENGWKRSLSSCFSCINDAASLATWSGINVAELSRFLTPDEIFETRKWLAMLAPTEYAKAEYAEVTGINLPVYDLCRGSLLARLGTADPDLNNKGHEQVIKRFLLSAVRMCLATKNFIKHFQPELSLVAGGEDFVSRSYMAMAQAAGTQVALFRWDLTNRVVKLHHPREKTVLACALLLSGVSSMRSDVRTWPAELVSIVEEIAAFLGVEVGQLPLQIAK